MVISLIKINDQYLSINDQNKNKHLPSSKLTRFHSRAPPMISVYDYLLRLTEYNNLENSVLITAIYYIDLLSNNYKSFNLNSLTVHRFLLTATTVASKGLCDYFCTNVHYAKVGGVKVNELNFLEMEFLERIDWRIIPHDDADNDNEIDDSDDNESVKTKYSLTNQIAEDSEEDENVDELPKKRQRSIKKSADFDNNNNLRFSFSSSSSSSMSSNQKNKNNNEPDTLPSFENLQNQQQQKQILEIQIFPPSISRYELQNHKLPSSKSIIKKRNSPMVHTTEILENYYRKMVELVGNETSINLDSTRCTTSQTEYIL